MTGNLLIISGSARKDGDTKRYIDSTFKDIDYEIIDLVDYKIAHYSYLNDYAKEDEFLEIIDIVLRYDHIVFATPVYWYSMSGIMKVFFDRLTDLVTVSKEKGRKLENKSIFLISTGSDQELPPGFEIPFKQTSDYLGWLYKGSLYLSAKDSSLYRVEKETFFANQIRSGIKNKDLI